jgi:MFS family permease
MRRAAEDRRLILAVVAFGVFVAADDLLVVSTMLRPMIDDLGLVLPRGIDDAAWIVNVYLIAYVAVMPLAGRLSDVFGRRAVFVGALAVFLAGSVVVPLAESLEVMLAGRALTAIGGGALVPVGMAVVGDVYREPARARALGLLAGVGTLGWVWGPLYGALLVRFLAWEWQFWLNVPLALAGIAAAWVVLSPTRRAERRIDWLGAALLTTGLIALNVALLAEARIQSVSGLEELTGDGGGIGGPWLYALAVAAIAGFVLVERRARDPLVDVRALAGPGMAPAVLVNAIVGAGLVIAVVDVPLYVNVVESGIRHSAVVAGAVLTALTAAMAVTSYLGGLATARVGYRPPTLLGLALATGALILMGAVWDADTDRWTMAAHLMVLGAGVGLVLAPTTAAVVDAAPPERRGVFAGLVLQFRLMGFSIGLAGLTAWGTHRFNALRADLVLPPLGDPTAAAALADAETRITTSALAETFLVAGAVMLVAVVVAIVLPWGPAPGRQDARSHAASPRRRGLGSASPAGRE